jgi:hypothetical protein
MKLKLFGALVGAALLGMVGSANAVTVNGTNTLNNLGAIGSGATPINIAAASGNSGASFTGGQHYFDYLVGFTLSSASDVTITSSPVVGTNLKDYGTAIFTSSANAGLFASANNGLNILLTNALTPSATGGTTLTTTNLAAGSYFLRLFGVIAGQGNNSFLTSLTGSINVTPVASTPIPAGLLLFTTALGGLGFAAWRRKTTAPTAAV